MDESRSVLKARLCKEGRWGEASKYKDEIIKTERLAGRTDAGVNYEAWDAMEAAYPPVEEQPEPEEEITLEENAGMEFLPDYERWVSLHPALGIPKTKENEKILECIKQYEEEYPCPNQMSRTMLNDYRNDKDSRKKFYSEISKKNFEEMKSGNKEESAAVVANRKHTKKIEDVLGLTKPA